MDSQLSPLIVAVRRLSKDQEERDLIAVLINALDVKYDLARKMAKEPGLEEILQQHLGRLSNTFGSWTTVAGKRILDIACGSNSSRSPSTLDIDTPFGEKRINIANTENYAAQFEPWCCRVLLQLNAEPVGVDLGNLEDEAFEHYSVDLGQIGALDFLLSHSFDAVQDSRLFGSPEFTAQFPNPADRLKVAVELRRQEQRLLKAGGRIIHSDAEALIGE